MSALIIAIYLFLGGHFGGEFGGPRLIEDYKIEYTRDQMPQSQDNTSWELNGI
ncbi:MAG: hypothetical protein Sapg2KO_26210 [Saprospiraceae bacterium]